ncbi:MFS transporter [Paenibacillus sp. N4]|uniref:MFS transporter n=1 Tax=Paenibacillus vietnamensis TaxID=2590547 RepID=UPI001CD17130|nr:MFS transporter [Paenibacillus vietnamensis]MCA0756827.1 MFS transporter [Paenibacillus vietnamensis]
MINRPFHMIKAFNFFVYGAIAVYSTFFALYLQSVGMSTLEIGALMAGGPVVSLLANPFWGYLSDRFRNIRLILIFMLTGSMLIMQFVFLSGSYTLIYAAMLCFFFFQMPLFSQSNSLILNSIEGTAHQFGAFRLFGSLGWAVMAAGAGPVIGRIGIDRLWIVYTAMMLLALAFAMALPKGESHGAAGKRKVRMVSLLGNRLFVLFLAIGLVISIPNSMNTTFISLYISDLGGEASLIGWAAFWSSIFEIPVFLLLDRYLKKNTGTMLLCVVAIGLLYALRWFLMADADNARQIIYFQMLHCLTFGMYYYIGTQLTVMLVPAELRASGQALYALTYGGLSGMAAGVVGGWMFQALGPAAMYRSGGFLSLAGSAAFLLLYWRLRRKGESALPVQAGG